jgi:hypothetical protein
MVRCHAVLSLAATRSIFTAWREAWSVWPAGLRTAHYRRRLL